MFDSEVYEYRIWRSLESICHCDNRLPSL